MNHRSTANLEALSVLAGMLSPRGCSWSCRDCRDRSRVRRDVVDVATGATMHATQTGHAVELTISRTSGAGNQPDMLPKVRGTRR